MTAKWWALTLAIASIVTIIAGSMDLSDPPGFWIFPAWPVYLLLWFAGPGPILPGGYREGTPVHAVAIWVGYGLTCVFWIVTGRLFWLRFRKTA